MPSFKVGVSFHPQHTTVARMREAWKEADAMGADSIWTWDHFFPLYGEKDGPHFESYTLLAAAACDTRNASIGAMVTCNSYRNPALLADMVRTLDHVSGGRAILGIGSGWFQRDYDEYGYEFGTSTWRLEQLEVALPRIRERWAKLEPPPIQDRIPILIGGGGEKVTLRLVAEYADAWNGFTPVKDFARKNAVLDEWCGKAGRDPLEIERTVVLEAEELDQVEGLLGAGATHLILEIGFEHPGDEPFDLGPLRTLLELRDG